MCRLRSSFMHNSHCSTDQVAFAEGLLAVEESPPYPFPDIGNINCNLIRSISCMILASARCVYHITG